MKSAYILTILFILSACNPQRKIDKAKVRLDSSGQAAAYCAIRFPVKDSVIIRTDWKFDTIYQGETFFDTITLVKSDTVFKTVIKTITAPQIIKEVTVTKEVTRENTAVTDSLKRFYGNLIKDRDKELIKQGESLNYQQGKANQYRRQRNTAYLLILLLAAFVLRKPIFRALKIV